VVLETTFSKTASLTNSYTFSPASSHSVGALLVFVATARATTAINFANTATDDAGNTWTKRVQGTQSNNLTVTAVYDCVLTNAVTSATVVTLSMDAGTYSGAQHITLFTLTGVTGYDSSAQANSGGAALFITNSVTTGGPATGVAIHGISTGSSNTVSTNSANWTLQSSLVSVTSCEQFTATATSTSWVDPVSDTFTMNSSTQMAGVIAYYA
jgi:hypothetical protein